MSLKAHPCSSRSLQIVADILVDAMQRQDKDGHLPCPLLLAIACNFLRYRSEGDRLGQQSVRQTRMQHPDVIRAFLRFFMRPRSADELETLNEIPTPNPGACFCARNNYDNNAFLRELHDEEGMTKLTGEKCAILGTSALQVLLFDVSNYLCIAINLAFEGVPIRRLMKDTGAQRGAWPRDLDDVFPYGAAASMTSLCDWFDYSSGTVLLICTLQIRVLGVPFLGHFARTIIPRVLLPGLNSVMGMWRPLGRETRHGDDTLAGILRTISHLAGDTLCIVLSLNDRRLCTAMKDDLGNLMHLGKLCLDIYHEMENTLISRTSLHPEWDNAIQPLLLECHIRLRLLFDPQASRPFPRGAEALISDIRAKASEPLGQQLFDYGDLLICANLGCERTNFSVHHSLARCGKCKYILYCSRECQRAAWRHTDLPHRDICTNIALAKGQIVLSSLVGLRESSPTYSEIDNDDMKEVLCHLDAIYFGPKSIA